jgi:hypothetical protein
MPDGDAHNFHEFALKIALFKGRPDLYFCYLKSEKIAHALARMLSGFEVEGNAVPETLLRSSAYLPSSIVRFAAGELEESAAMVDVFELLSLVRLCVSHGVLEENNAELISQEYERIAEKISLGKNASPFLSLEDLAVPSLIPPVTKPYPQGLAAGKQNKGQSIKDIKGQNERTSAILKIVLEKQRVSIKDIALLVKDCSEKTIQRELAELVRQGLVRKEGERRWSVYMPGDRQAPEGQ